MFDIEFVDKKLDFMICYVDYVVFGQGLDDMVDVVVKIKWFKKEEFFQIFVSVNMLDIGFDCLEVVNFIMVRFMYFFILYQQMWGCGMC